ncbi:acyl carrier protein [Streptomyces filipinensis]|uniref:acyl carrier protein n=1 Tax=Streptomyces filipinensis TaxID=66887 RepID=UPI0027E42CCF|nr:acyl carrier protein [Streptomyces filipinensis]
MREEVEQKVIETVAEVLNKERNAITSDSRFKEDLDADSLNIVELLMRIEVDFKVEIPDEHAEKILSVAHLVEYILVRHEKHKS